MTAPFRVYLAGSSLEIERVERWRDQLRGAGIDVVSTWTDSVRQVGESNPRSASQPERWGWAMTCVNQVRRADLAWILVPPVTAPTRGAWCELMVAAIGGHELGPICSGDTLQTTFCALGDEYATDEEAFTAILAIAGAR